MGRHPWPAEQNRGRFYARANGQSVPLLAGELRGSVSAWREVNWDG